MEVSLIGETQAVRDTGPLLLVNSYIVQGQKNLISLVRPLLKYILTGF